MKIIIAGDGKVGATLTRQFTAEDHDVTIIDSDPGILDSTMERYDLISVQGNCASMTVLNQAGVKEADLLVAVTNHDEINLLCCTTAHSMNPKLHTIARIRNPEYNEQAYKMRDVFGLSLVINPENQAATEIHRLLKYPGFLRRDTFAKGRTEIVELRVDAGSKLRNVKLMDLKSIVKCQVLVCAVLRNGSAIAPGGDFILREGDRIFVTALSENLTTLLNKVYKVLIVVLGVMTMAQESGLPVGSIVASAGLVGLTISLAAQDSAKNLFSGLVILLDRPFSIGDWITIGDVSGEVVDINFRSTKVRALDNSVYILTNSTVSSATINNGTLRNKRLYRFTLGVTYDTTRPRLEQLMADLTAMLKASPYTYEDSVLVKLNGFGASSIDLLVSAYLRTADMTRFLQMQNDLNLDLMDVMQKNGVDFAFPSTTVYLEKNSES